MEHAGFWGQGPLLESYRVCLGFILAFSAETKSESPMTHFLECHFVFCPGALASNGSQGLDLNCLQTHKRSKEWYTLSVFFAINWNCDLESFCSRTVEFNKSLREHSIEYITT